MSKKEFIKCFAHFITETDLNESFESHFKELGNMNYNQVKEWLENILNDNNWIPCNQAMPEEHNSVFSKLKDTDKWRTCMWEKRSDNVIVTIQFEDGTKETMTSHTKDGKWHCMKEYRPIKMEVIAWKPFPKPYKGD